MYNQFFLLLDQPKPVSKKVPTYLALSCPALSSDAAMIAAAGLIFDLAEVMQYVTVAMTMTTTGNLMGRLDQQASESAWTLSVNGTDVRIHAQGDTSLLAALRHDLDLKGTRIGCGEGNCGACTVLVDGMPVQSCTTPLWSVKDHNVQTIEGLITGDASGDLTSIFLAEQAAQCGYCINGIIMTITGMLARTPPASRSEIVAALDERHLCRCGSQVRILRALDRAIAERGARQS